MRRKGRKDKGAKPGSRIPLARERILQAAVDLADEAGLEALSMRELGRKLGVEAMSLYNHVASKDDVLDGMVDLVVAEIELPSEGADWRQFMRSRAVSARKAFTRHAWATSLIDTRVGGGSGRLRYFEAVIGVLRRAGFPLELAARAFSLVDSYIYGFCRQASNLSSAGGENAEVAEAFLDVLPENQYPNLAEMAALHAAKPYDEEADFEFGLGLILDGLQRARDAARS
jgi:AcrR family transcriptional regulator